MNEGKKLSPCNCPCMCTNESFAEFCMDCEITHKYQIANLVYERNQLRGNEV